MDRRTKWIVGGTVAAAVVAGGAAMAIASGTGDIDSPLTGSSLDRATAAALRHTGGGTVIETEVGDEGASYGVEIRLADGSVVEIGLDRNFHVIAQSTDDDGPADREEPGDG